MTRNNKNIKNSIVISIILLLICIPIGYLFYWYIGLKIINQLYYIDHILKGIFLYSLHVLFLYLFMKIILNIKIFKIEKVIILISYYLLMGITFFDRIQLAEKIINLDPFDFINNFQSNGLSTIVLNIIIFIPFFTSLTWLFTLFHVENKINIKTFSIIFIVLAIGIEFIQYITMKANYIKINRIYEKV